MVKCMAVKKRRTAKKTATTAVTKPNSDQFMNLLRLTAAEMIGFIFLEVVIWLLIVVNMIPATIVIKRIGLLEISMNTGYLVLIGLVAVLVASFWLAILVQAGIVKMEEIDFKI